MRSRAARRRARRSCAAPARAARSGCPCVKNALSARSACCGNVDLALAQALHADRPGGRSTSSISSARSRIESGTVSRTRHAGDLRHHVVEAVDVLDVERGVDVDAGVEQLLDVLPALGVARARARWCAPARRAGADPGGGRAPRRDRTLEAQRRGTRSTAAAAARCPPSAPRVSARPCVSTAPDSHADAGVLLRAPRAALRRSCRRRPKRRRRS